jgi:hypothetical protein
MWTRCSRSSECANGCSAADLAGTALVRQFASALLFGLLHALGGGSAHGQDLQVTADTRRVTVGDPVTLEVRARLGEGAALVSRVPAPLDSLPEGLRVLSADSLTPSGADVLAGTVRVAFFRPGRHRVPPLAVAYRPSARAPVDTLVSQPVPVEVAQVLPPGEQALKDIKDLEPLPPKSNFLLWLALLAAAVAAAYVVYRRLRRRPSAPLAVVAVGPAPDARSAYEVALSRLGEVERARLPARGEVVRHYVLVANILRRYLEEADGLPARERTTAELIWSLPSLLSGDGLRDACGELLEAADLVKFARMRPDGAAATRFLQGIRRLLGSWHAARLESERALAAAQRALDEADALTPAGSAPGGDGPGASPGGGS